MDEMGGMLIRNITEPVMEVFEVTGFSDILNIEWSERLPEICIHYGFGKSFLYFFIIITFLIHQIRNIKSNSVFFTNNADSLWLYLQYWPLQKRPLQAPQKMLYISVKSYVHRILQAAPHQGYQGDRITLVTALWFCRTQAAKRLKSSVTDDSKQRKGNVVIGSLSGISQNRTDKGKHNKHHPHRRDRQRNVKFQPMQHRIAAENRYKLCA